MSLLDALCPRPGIVAAVGAGGKTTLVYALAREALARGLRVVVTTTTHMGTLPREVTGPVLEEEPGEDVTAALTRALDEEGRATLLGHRSRADKRDGVAPQRVAALRALADVVLVEADGARSRSLKAPAAHEPVVPAGTDTVVILAALDVLGQPLDDGCVHRVEQVLAAAGGLRGRTVDEDVIVATLAAPEGYRSRLPPGARVGVFFNKAEDPEALAAAERMAARLLPAYAFVLAGSARGGIVRRHW